MIQSGVNMDNLLRQIPKFCSFDARFRYNFFDGCGWHSFVLHASETSKVSIALSRNDRSGLRILSHGID